MLKDLDELDELNAARSLLENALKSPEKTWESPPEHGNTLFKSGSVNQVFYDIVNIIGQF